MQPSSEPPPHLAPCLSSQQADSQRPSSSTISLPTLTAPQRAFPTQCTPRSTLTWLWVEFGLPTHLILLTCWMFLNLSSEDIVHPLRQELYSGLLFPPRPVQCLSESVPSSGLLIDGEDITICCLPRAPSPRGTILAFSSQPLQPMLSSSHLYRRVN